MFCFNCIGTIFCSFKDAHGWTYFSRGSENGSSYVVVNRLLTYNAAQDECGRLGGHLARVDTIREQIFLEDFLGLELEREGKTPGLFLGI